MGCCVSCLVKLCCCGCCTNEPTKLRAAIVFFSTVHLLWFLLASFPTMIGEFDYEACISFIHPQAVLAEFLLTQLLGYGLLAPWVFTDVLKSKAYVGWHLLLSVVFVVVMFAEFVTNSASTSFECAGMDFGNVYYKLVANGLGFVFGLAQSFYSFRLMSRYGCCGATDPEALVDIIELGAHPNMANSDVARIQAKSLLLALLPTTQKIELDSGFVYRETAKEVNNRSRRNIGGDFLGMFSSRINQPFNDLKNKKDDQLANAILSFSTTSVMQGLVFDILRDIVADMFALPEPDWDDEPDELKRKTVEEFDNSSLHKRLEGFRSKLVVPENLQELINFMQNAVDTGKNIKAMGTKYGWTNITFTDGVLIDTFAHIENVDIGYDARLLNNFGIQFHNEQNFLCCESGCSVEQIQLYLWPFDRRRETVKDDGSPFKYFPDSAGYPKLSLGGCVSVGAMGAGTPFSFGGICKYVASICLLMVNKDRKVVMVQIEPSVGNGAIHDAQKWAASPDKRGIQLIQDDNVFDAVLVSLGLMGILYSFILKLQNAHFIRETRQLMPFAKFAKEYETDYVKRAETGEIQRMVFWFSPYTVAPEFADSPPVVVTLHTRTDEIPPHRIGVINAGSAQGTHAAAIAGGALITWLTRVMPLLVPFAMLMALKTTVHDGVVMPCVQAIEFGAPNAVPVQAMGVATHAKNAIPSARDYIRVCNEMRERDAHQLVTGTFSMRFGSAQRGFLQLTQGQPTVWFEEPLTDFTSSHWGDVGDTPKWKETFRIMQALYMDKYEGVMHPALWLDVNPEMWRNVKQMKAFIQQYRIFNQFGYFSNAFSKQSGLDQMAGIPQLNGGGGGGGGGNMNNNNNADENKQDW